MFSYFH